MIDKRIAYYTRKVAEAGDRKRKFNKYRHDRLLTYKNILDRKIKEERQWTIQ